MADRPAALAAPVLMRVLVTGHRGYIGAILVPRLLAAGHTVVGLDARWFDGGTPAAAVEDRHGDVRDVEPSDLAGIDAVIHLAALSNDVLGEIDPATTMSINHGATVRLAEIARAAGVERFLFASTCSVYGPAGDAPVTEDATPQPLTSYALAKTLAERDLVAMADARFVPVLLRAATVHGASPALRLDLVLNNLVAWAVATGEARLQTDGSPRRPLVHVADLADTYVALLDAPADAVRGLPVNVGSDRENHRVRDIAALAAAQVPGGRLVVPPMAGGDARSYVVAFDRLRRILPGLRFDRGAAAGAAEIADHCRRAPVRAEDIDGPRYRRLGRLRALIETGRLDTTFRRR